MQTLPVRLQPGVDLRAALEAAAGGQGGFVVAAIGSLSSAALRFADQPEATLISGPLEVISLSGSLSEHGAHLHMSVSDSAGRVWGGHVTPGNIVRTTLEALIVILPDWSLGREHDPGTGFAELVARPRQKPSPS